MIESTLQVAQNALQGSQVWCTRIKHEETNMLDGIADIGVSEGKTLQGTSKTAVQGWISHWGAKGCRQLGGNFRRGAIGITIGHGCPREF